MDDYQDRDHEQDESRQSCTSLRTDRNESASFDRKLRKFASLRNSSQKRRGSNTTCVTMATGQSAADSEVQLVNTNCTFGVTHRLPLRSLANVYWKIPIKNGPQTSWYARLLARRPWLVIIFWLLLAAVATTMCIVSGNWPHFADPHVGFEAQNTEIAAKIVTWKLVRGETSSVPFRISEAEAEAYSADAASGGRSRRSVAKDSAAVCVTSTGDQSRLIYRIASGSIVTQPQASEMELNPNPNQKQIDDTDVEADGALLHQIAMHVCRFESQAFDANEAYSKLCLRNGDAVCCPRFSLPNAMALWARKTHCDRLTQTDSTEFFREAVRCVAAERSRNANSKRKTSQTDAKSVRKAACTAIRVLRDLVAKSDLLETNGTLRLRKFSSMAPDLYVLTELPVIDSADDKSAAGRASRVALFESIERVAANTPSNLTEWQTPSGNLAVSISPVAVDLGPVTKSDVFGKAVIRDCRLLALSAFALLVLLLAYGRLSVVLAVGALGGLALVYVMAYFVYSVVFGIQFFSVLNLLAVVLLLAIGTDNFFLMHQQFSALCTAAACRQQSATPSNHGDASKVIWPALVSELYRSVTRHILAINGTTLAGCALNALIAVPVLRCFALFSSVLVVFHALVALSWLPAVLLLHFRFLAPISVSYEDSRHRSRRPSAAAAFFRSIAARFDDAASLIESGVLRYCVVLPIRYLRYVLIFIFIAAAFFSVYFIAANADRRLTPLTSNSSIAQLKLAARRIRLFSDVHPLERYDEVVANFAFEQERRAGEPNVIPLAFVFGFTANDPRSPFDPETAARGSQLMRDSSFEPLSRSTQQLLLDMCSQLESFEFVSGAMREWFAHNDACFMRSFRQVLVDRCGLNCCEPNAAQNGNGSNWQLEPKRFERCMFEYQKSIVRLRDMALSKKFESGPRYARDNSAQWNASNIVGYLIHVATDRTLAHTVADLESFRTRTTDWFESIKRRHPDVPLAQAFFTSAFAEYDLFRALRDGLVYAAFATTGCVLLVTLVATRNVLLTCITCMTVAIACAVTALLLTVAGWTLGVAEAVCVTLLIGLSIDYALHCALTLADSAEKKRWRSSVARTFSKVSAGGAIQTYYVPDDNDCDDDDDSAGPLSDVQLEQSLKPLLYAALSSLLVALPLLFSDVALFRQTSAFILILVGVSWCTATLFLVSCLKVCENLFVRSALRC